MSAIQIIVELIGPGPTSATKSIEAEAWEDIAVTAIVLGLAPLLHWRLEQRAVAVPAMVMAKLALTRQAHAKRNQAIAGQLADILAACARQQIDVIVLKGALLAPLAYPEPALRPMNDIDLLFYPQTLPAVGRLLTDLGYQGKYKAATQGAGITKHLATYRRSTETETTPNPYLSPGSDRTVEPHGSLEEAWFGLRVDITPGVWERAQPLTLHGQPAHRLSTPDLIIHLAVHAAFHVIMGTSLFVQLYDLVRLLVTWPAEVDWCPLVARARDCQADPFVYAGLYWAHTLYQAPVPEPVLTALSRDCPPSLLAHIRALDAPALFQRTQQPPLVNLAQRLRRGWRDRREAARWAASLAQKWQVWQTALAVHKTDTLTLLLGKKLKADA